VGLKIVRKKGKIVIESTLDENEYNSFISDYNQVLSASEKGNHIPADFVVQMLNRLGTKSNFDELNIQIETITSNVYERVKSYDFNLEIPNTSIVLSLEELIHVGVSTAIRNNLHDNDPNQKRDIVIRQTYLAIDSYLINIPNKFSPYKKRVITGVILTEIGYSIVNPNKKKINKKRIVLKDYSEGIKYRIKKLIKEKGED